MSDNLLAGIDCGATKVLIQSAIIEPGTKNVYPGKINKEFVYSDHAEWNKKFLPVPLNIQKCEYFNNFMQIFQEKCQFVNKLIAIFH